MKRRIRRGGVWKHGRVYWCSYMVDGRQVKENTHCLTREEAIEFRASRIVARGRGTLVKGAKDVTLADLRRLAEDRYVADGRRAIRRLRLGWNALEAGLPERAMGITSAVVSKYERERLEAGRARSTVNYELACLRHAWRLATSGETPLLPPGRMPVIKTPTPQNARQGIVDREQLTTILAKLPEWAAAVCIFLALTGWRVSEALGLQWGANVDRTRKVLRLEATDTKGGIARTFPYGELPVLDKLITGRRSIVSQTGHVFTKNGSPVPYKALRKAWNGACVEANCSGKLMHDLRRSAASAFVEAGVDEATIMQLCGWETRTMFDRYHIVSEAAKSAAVAKLAAKLEPPTPSSPKSTVAQRLRRRSA